MNGKAYEVITSSIREAINTTRGIIEDTEGDVSITFEEVIDEIISNLERKMRDEGWDTSNLRDDCEF
jgi:hypothetical protein